MKTRQGFVSNSSTSSFCIYGTYECDFSDGILLHRTLKEIFPKQFDKLIENMKEYSVNEMSTTIKWIEDGMLESAFNFVRLRGCEHPLDDKSNFCQECGKPTWKTEPNLDKAEVQEYLSDDVDGILDGFPITYVHADGIEAIGMKYDSAPDDLTFGEFRNQTKDLLSKILGKEVKCKHIEDSYYN